MYIPSFFCQKHPYQTKRGVYIMKIRLIELSAFLALFICIISCLSFEKECEDIRQKVMRLHVIANSDSPADQQLKLKVRDRILEDSEDLFSSSTLKEAEKDVEAALDALSESAESAVRKEGCDLPVRVTFEPSYFPTRQYESVTLPAGTYKSLKVIIGEGEGKNWWCVLFPPMCLPAAQKEEDVLSAVLSEEELKLVSSKPKYEVRFWIVEKLQEIKISYKRKA